MISVLWLSLLAADEFPLSKEISPCVDFYEYVCSEKSKGFKLREDRGIHLFSFSGLSEDLLLKKKAYLLEVSRRSPLNSRESSIQNMYLACMNPTDSARDESLKIESVKNDLKGIRSRGEMLNFLASRLFRGETSFIDFHAEPNFQNPKIWDLVIDIPLLVLPEKSYFANQELMKDFQKLIQEFFALIGFRDAERRAQSVIDFQKAFAEVSPSPLEWRQIGVTPSSIDAKTLLTRFPNLGLEALTSKLSKGTLIRFPTPKLFEFLQKSFEDLSIDDLKSIFIFRSLYGMIDDSNPAFQQKKHNFGIKYLGGVPVRPERDERCSTQIMYTLGRELDFELSRRLFANFPGTQVQKIVKSVSRAILKSLESNHWLSPTAKAEALKKIKTARLQIGLPESESMWDFSFRTEYTKNRPAENGRRFMAAQRKKELWKLQRARNLRVWDMSPLAVNASYDPQSNKFVLPAGILQAPFFDARASEVVNLGGIGSIIGHELGHAIDDQGSKFDSQGLMRAWMTPKDLSLFAEKSEPLLRQFENAGYIGKLTLGENIGDLVGVSFALNAALPHSDLSRLSKKEEQRAEDFFVQFARIWCAVARPEFLAANKKVNVHAQPKSRVNEQLKNQKLFQKVYGCKDQDPMVLPDSGRAQIW